MNNNNSGRNVLGTILAVIGLIIVVALLIYGHTVGRSTASQASIDMNHAKVARKAYIHKRHRVTTELFGGALDSSDPIIRSIAVNKYTNNMIFNPFYRFFTIYYDWNDHQDYVSRPQRLKGVASNAVLSNKYYFDNDLDNSHQSVIDNEELNSQYHNMNLYILRNNGQNMTILADVQYVAWYSGNTNSNKPIGEKWFAMNFNVRNKEITSIKTLYTKPNVQDQNS